MASAACALTIRPFLTPLELANVMYPSTTWLCDEPIHVVTVESAEAR
ncbi:hypothetical protein WME91_11970 [Sorangium sp. So ce269]